MGVSLLTAVLLVAGSSGLRRAEAQTAPARTAPTPYVPPQQTQPYLQPVSTGGCPQWVLGIHDTRTVGMRVQPGWEPFAAQGSTVWVRHCGAQ